MTNLGEAHSRRDVRRTRDRRRLAWGALLLACTLVLAWPAVEGVRVSRSLLNGTWHARAAGEQALFDCLDQRVSELVPKGDRVYVDSGTDLSKGTRPEVDLSGAALSSTELSVHQRVIESVAARPAEPMPSPEGADLTLVVDFDPGDPGAGPLTCDGYTVSAVPA